MIELRRSFYARCLGLCLAFCAAPLSAQNPLENLRFEPIAAGLQSPTSVTHAGDGSGRLFITQQEGELLVHSGSQLHMTPFLDISSKVECCGETGLLSVAFHPDYEANGYFYVFYTGVSEQPDRVIDSIVSRFQVSQEDPNRADPDSEKVILRVPQPTGVHEDDDERTPIKQIGLHGRTARERPL